jgi:hypothetical protein
MGISGLVARSRGHEGSEISCQAYRESEIFGVYRRTYRPQMFGGGPLNRQVGDYMAKEGIVIDPGYGLCVSCRVGFVSYSHFLFAEQRRGLCPK